MAGAQQLHSNKDTAFLGKSQKHIKSYKEKVPRSGSGTFYAF